MKISSILKTAASAKEEYADWIYAWLKKNPKKEPAMLFLGSLVFLIEDAFMKEKGMESRDYFKSDYARYVKSALKKAYTKLYGDGVFEQLVANNKRKKTSGKKLSPKEKAKQLGLTGSVAERVIAAYSDSFDDVDAERNLDYFESTGVTAQQFIEIMSKVVPDYNDFDGSASTKQVVAAFGTNATYHIARESSVCVYVDLTSENTWLKNLSKIKADEFSYNGKKKMFRVWWD
jgi:hypothetical protein